MAIENRSSTAPVCLFNDRAGCLFSEGGGVTNRWRSVDATAPHEPTRAHTIPHEPVASPHESTTAGGSHVLDWRGSSVVACLSVADRHGRWLVGVSFCMCDDSRGKSMPAVAPPKPPRPKAALHACRSRYSMRGHSNNYNHKSPQSLAMSRPTFNINSHKLAQLQVELYGRRPAI